MNASTLEHIKLTLRLDPSISAAQRTQILRRLREPDAPSTSEFPPKIVRRAEAAAILSRSLRSIDLLAKEGVLRRVVLPGRSRAAGFSQADVLALLAAKA